MPLFFLASLFLFLGCVGNPTAEFNKANCNRLNSLYGSFQGAVCAKELTKSFAVELSQLQQAGHKDIADNVRAAAEKNSIVSYSCNQNNLDAGVVFKEASICSENQECVQSQNIASCKSAVKATEIPSLEEILDLWDKQELPVVKIDAFCDDLYSEHNKGNKVIEYGANSSKRADGTVDYAYWVKAGYCDPRQGKENNKVEVLCEQLVGARWKSPERSFEWKLTAAYSPCSETESCSVVSEFNAKCVVPSAQELLGDCETISGEIGVTGPEAVPPVSFNYSFFDNPDLDNEKVFLDGEQFLIKLYRKLAQFENSYRNSEYSKTAYAGDEIAGLKGKGAFAGKELKIKIVAIVLTEAAVTAYQARMELYDSEGNLVDTQTVGAGAFLSDLFVSSENYVLAETVSVPTITIDNSTGKGFAIVTVRTSPDEKQFNKDSEFVVRLRTERYTTQMLRDFADLRNTQFFSTPESFNNKWYKFFEEPIIDFGFTNVSAGEYRAKMVFDWAEEPYNFFDSAGKPAVKSVGVTLQKISNPAEKEKSPFLEFSLDYDLAGQNQGKAKEYGAQFTGSSSQENLILYQASGQQTAMTSLLAGEAYKQILLTSQNDFSALNSAGQRGNVLAMHNSASSMAVSFSRAIPVGALIDLSNKNSGSYQLETIAGEPAVGPDVSSFNEWANACSDSVSSSLLTVQDSKISEGQSNDSCIGGYKIVFDSGNLGEIFAQAMFFTPTNNNEQAILLSNCGTKTNFATTENSALVSGTIQLNTAKNGPAIQSIENLFVQIKNKNICVVRSPDKTIFAWNKKAFESQQENILRSLGMADYSQLPGNGAGGFQQNFDCNVGDESTDYLLFDIDSAASEGDKVKVSLHNSIGHGLAAVFDSENNLIERAPVFEGSYLQVVIRDKTALRIGLAPSYKTKWEDTKKDCSLEINKQPGHEFSATPQKVLLDFDGGNDIVVYDRGPYSFGPMDAGELNPEFEGQTGIMKELITQLVREQYAGYNVEISTTDEPLPAEPYSTIYFAPIGDKLYLGLADDIDNYNFFSSDNAIIYLKSFSVDSIEKTSQMLGNTASHELGHLLGLYHVSDNEDIMVQGRPSWSATERHDFKTSRLVEVIFPIGNQNAPQLLAWGVGKK
ncbi:MAG: hypothetical protein PHD95_01270 [Candidatus ainarchaeum sp.]|nr:hypothetical protein [Candidatus ainarchaeum sp.]